MEWSEKVPAFRAQPSIRGQRPVFSQPRTDGAFWDVAMKTFAQGALGLGE